MNMIIDSSGNRFSALPDTARAATELRFLLELDGPEALDGYLERIEQEHEMATIMRDTARDAKQDKGDVHTFIPGSGAPTSSVARKEAATAFDTGFGHDVARLSLKAATAKQLLRQNQYTRLK